MTALLTSTAAPPDVRRFRLLLHEPGDVFEIRIPKHGILRASHGCLARCLATLCPEGQRPVTVVT